MATGARAGTHVLAIHGEDAFNTRNAGWTSDRKRLPTWDVTPGLKHQAIENQSVRVDLGEHPPGVGIAHPESEVSLSAYAKGLGTAAGDAVLAVINAMSTLLAGCLGGTPTASTGSTVGVSGHTPGSSSSADTVKETDAGNHAANSLVAFTDDTGYVRVRPVSTYATDTMSLLLNLPSTLTDGNVIYGGINIKNVEDSLYTIQGELVGKNTAQNYEFYGSVGNFTLAEASEAEAQTLQFSFKAASFARYVSATQTAPSIDRPLVNSGGEYIIAKYGTFEGANLDLLRVGIELGREYTADPQASDDDGICGWVLTNQAARITLHVRDTAAMPTGFTVANYFSAFGSSDTTENDFHILLNFGGGVAGKIFSIYVPRTHLIMEPEPVDVDGLMAQKLTFALTQDSSITNKVWVAQH